MWSKCNFIVGAIYDRYLVKQYNNPLSNYFIGGGDIFWQLQFPKWKNMQDMQINLKYALDGKISRYLQNMRLHKIRSLVIK